MAGRPKRAVGSRRITAWLLPDAFEALENWRRRNDHKNRTDTLNRVLLSVGRHQRKLEDKERMAERVGTLPAELEF
jgi:hypothetical protein